MLHPQQQNQRVLNLEDIGGGLADFRGFGSQPSSIRRDWSVCFVERFARPRSLSAGGIRELGLSLACPWVLHCEDLMA